MIGGPTTPSRPSSSCPGPPSNTYVLQLADGRAVKLVVDGYYAAEAQADCNSGSNAGGSRAGAANMRLRWAFLTASP